MPTEEKVITKMSVKELGCNPKQASALDVADKRSIPLCMIMGRAIDTEVKEDKRNGNIYTALLGDFQGVCIQAGNSNFGQYFKSGKLYLPGGIQELIEAAIVGDGKGASAVVHFALEIHAVRATNPIGYSYQAIPRMRPVIDDPLQRIREMVMQQVQLPPAPLPAPPLLPPAPLPAPPLPVTSKLAALPEPPAPPAPPVDGKEVPAEVVNGAPVPESETMRRGRRR